MLDDEESPKNVLYKRRILKSYEDTDEITWHCYLFIFQDENKEEWCIESPAYDDFHELAINAREYVERIEKGEDCVNSMIEWKKQRYISENGFAWNLFEKFM